MAELYLSLAGNDSWDGLSTGTAKKTWTGIAAIIASGDVVHILPGTYIGASYYIALNNAKFSGIKILCEDEVFWNVYGDYQVLYATSATQDVYVEKLIGIGNSKSFYLDGASGFTLNRCKHYSVQFDALWLNNAANINVIDCHFATEYYTSGTSAHANIAGTSSCNLIRTVLGGGKRAAGYGLRVQNTGAVVCDYVDVMNTKSHGVYSTSTGLATLNDSKIIGCAQEVYDAVPVFSNVQDKIVLNRCLVGQNPYTGAVQNGKAIFNDCKTTGAFGLKEYKRKIYVVPHIDDAANIAYAERVETEFAEIGVKGTYFVDVGNFDTANTARLAAIVERGTFEVAAHSWSHTNAAYVHAAVVSFSGAGTPSVVIAAGQIDFISTVPAESFSVAIGVLTTINDVVAAKTSAWSFAKSTADGQLATRTNWSALASGLAYVATSTLPATLDWDRGATGRHVLNETVVAKQRLEALLDGVTDPRTGEQYVCVSWGAPHNTANADYQAACKAGGFTSMRANGVLGLNAYNLYHANSIVMPTSTGDLLSRFGNMCTTGMISMLLAHTDADATPEVFADYMSALKSELKSQCVIDTARDCVAAAKEEGVYDVGTGILTTTYTPIDAAPENTARPFYGPYQGDIVAGPWTPFDSTLPALTLSSTAPGDLRSVQCWSKVASAREIGKY